MKIKVMYRSQCLAAALGHGPEYDTENIDEPTLIISISGTDDEPPLILNEAENKNIRHVEYLQFDDIDTAALAKAIGESDEKFFGRDYCVNNHVYTTLLRQLEKRNILK